MAPSKSIESLLGDFEELFATAWSGSSFSKNDASVRAFSTKNGILSLDAKANTSLKTVANEIVRSDIGVSFSQTFIEKRVDSTLAEIALASPDEVKTVISTQIRNLVTSLYKAEIKEYKVTVPVSGVKVWSHDRVFKVGKCWVYSLANHQEIKWLSIIAQHREISHLLKTETPGGSEHWIKTVVRSTPDDSQNAEKDMWKRRKGKEGLDVFSEVGCVFSIMLSAS